MFAAIAGWYHGFGDLRMVEIKIGLALVGGGALLWYWLADRVPLFARWRRLRAGLLIASAVVSCAAWWNLGRFHFNSFTHNYEIYHYYLGAKYGNELGYTRLYECTVVAEVEQFPRLRKAFEKAPIRDLTTNVLGTSADALDHPERCKDQFTPERWEAFKRDSEFFRHASSWSFYTSALKDNGFNATPVWRLTAGLIANRIGTINYRSMRWLASLDALLLFAMMGMVWWAFGWQTLCAVVVFFGTNYPGRYWWTGGAFLRMDWLFAMVAGICFAKRDKPFASGVAIGWATLLRIFPGFVAAALVLKMAIACVRERKLALTRAHKRWLAGAAVSFAVLVPVATVYDGGLDCWSGFVANSAKHLETPLTNNMGWRTILAFRPDTRAQLVRDSKAEDPFAVWKQDQLDNYAQLRLVWLAGLVGFLVLLGKAVGKHDDWVALVLGVGLILVAAQLTCYYYIAFLAFGLLWPYRSWSGWALMLLSYLSAQVPILIFHWDDEGYVALSVMYLMFVVAVTALLSVRSRPAALPPARLVPTPAAPEAAEAPARSPLPPP